MSELPRYWSSALMEAVRSDDHTVELVPAEPNGAQVEIDGVPMFDGLGYPHEQFNIASGGEYRKHVTDEGIEKLREITQEDNA